MPGIIDIYTSFADSHVELCLNKGKLETISRSKVELQLLNEVDKAKVPIGQKLSWYHAVLVSENFDGYWASKSTRYNLPESCTARYVCDQTLLDYEEPTEDEAEEGLEEDLEEGQEDEADHKADEDVDEEAYDDAATAGAIPPSVEGTPALTIGRNSRFSSPDTDYTYDSDVDPMDHPLALVRVRRPVSHCSSCNSNGHTDRECRLLHPDALECTAEKLESNFDSFESHKANVYGKILFIGLEQKPGEADSDFVRRGEAAREDPCAAWSETNPSRDEEADDESYEDSPYGCGCKRKVEAKPVNDSSSGPHEGREDAGTAMGGTNSLAQGSGQGAKRTLEEISDDEDDMPAAKKPRTGGAASADGGRKKATPRKAPAQARGLKRTLDQSSDEEEASRATKKAKTGGVASAIGGRRKATPKKQKKNGPEE